MITAKFIGDSVVSGMQEAFTLYEQSRLGEKKNGRIEYAGIEALYLVSEKKMQLYSGNKIISEEQLLRRLKKKDKKIEIKLIVFGDLRKRGYVLKTALKFGAEFRVYLKGVKPGEDHARWVLFTVRESERLDWHDFAAKNRVAHSAKKNLLIALVDDEGDVTYYEIGWIKP